MKNRKPFAAVTLHRMGMPMHDAQQLASQSRAVQILRLRKIVCIPRYHTAVVDPHGIVVQLR